MDSNSIKNLFKQEIQTLTNNIKNKENELDKLKKELKELEQLQEITLTINKEINNNPTYFD